jgi:hypothetical protein
MLNRLKHLKYGKGIQGTGTRQTGSAVSLRPLVVNRAQNTSILSSCCNERAYHRQDKQQVLPIYKRLFSFPHALQKNTHVVHFAANRGIQL